MSGPLRGVRVIDAGAFIAAPYAASLLADFGAEVVKVEPPSGDPGRDYQPLVDGLSTLFAAVNHSKQYVALDLRTAAGRDGLQRLLGQSDVLVHNLRAAPARALGLTAEACHDVNPRLVHCWIAGFHPDEPERPGYDLLMQAESGMMQLTGEPDGAPARAPASVIDHVTGLWAATAVLAALHGDRDRTALTIGMLDVALGLLNERVSNFLATGVEPTRMGSHTPVTTPHGAYPTASGDIVIGAASDRIFARFARALGPPLEDDDRFLTQSGRLAHRAELDGLIVDLLATRGAEEWCRVLTDADVPVGVARDLGSAVARHAAASRTGIRAVGDLGFGVLAPPLTLSASPWGPLPRPGEVGRDQHVLDELEVRPAAAASSTPESDLGR